jgi:hypothetical protein
MKPRINRFLFVRIFNKTRSCIMVRKYWGEDGPWTLPGINIPLEDDPFDHIPSVLTEIGGEFDLMSATSIFEIEQDVSDNNDGSEFYRSVFYDLRLKGTVDPKTEDDNETFETGKWITIPALKASKDLNIPSQAFAEMLEAHKCLA